MTYSKEELESCIKNALDDLYENDEYLIYREGSTEIEKHSGERSIMFWFAKYFELNTRKIFDEYNVDCEYNRNIYAKKILPGFENGIAPDVILHKRGTNDSNIIAIEIKTPWNTATKTDEKKLSELTNKCGVYRYSYGLSLKLGKCRECCKLKWFKNGKEITNNQ